MGQAVLHAAVHDALPIDAAVAHLVLELETMLGPDDDRVLAADEHQYPAVKFGEDAVSGRSPSECGL